MAARKSAGVDLSIGVLPRFSVAYNQRCFTSELLTVVVRPLKPAIQGERATMDQVTLTENQLEALQWVSVDYFLKEANHGNGLIRDKTQVGAPASIAAVGMALATAPLGVERGALPRDFIARRTLTRLRF